MSDLLCTKEILDLLDRIVPRIDAGGPNPIDEELHHCEYTLYRERERIHAEFRDHFRDAKKMVHEHSFSPSLLDGGCTLVCACGAWK